MMFEFGGEEEEHNYYRLGNGDSSYRTTIYVSTDFTLMELIRIINSVKPIAIDRSKDQMLLNKHDKYIKSMGENRILKETIDPKLIENETKYEQTIYIFKEIDPSKKFSSFDYTELNFDAVMIGYCNKGEILKIENKYYLYDGIKNYYWYEKKKPIIRFLSKSKVIKDILI